MTSKLSECEGSVLKFREGLNSIIPEAAFMLCSSQELSNLINGIGIIDIQRLKENTEYDDNINSNDAFILNFWDILSHEFTENEKMMYLKFVWARPTLPPIGTEFLQKMKIQSAVGEDILISQDFYLPRAHTCFFSINLPKYSNKKIMCEKLRYAIYNCTEMDADFKMTEVWYCCIILFCFVFVLFYNVSLLFIVVLFIVCCVYCTILYYKYYFIMFYSFYIYFLCTTIFCISLYHMISFCLTVTTITIHILYM